MQGCGAHEGEAVDVAEVDFAAEEEEGAESRGVVSLYPQFEACRGSGKGSLQEEEENRTRKIGIIHNMPINMHKRIQHRQRLSQR